MLLVRADWLGRRWFYNYIHLQASSVARNSITFQLITTDKVLFGAIFLNCVVHTYSRIHLGVGESGGYLPQRFAPRQTSATIHLHLSEQLLIIRLFYVHLCGKRETADFCLSLNLWVILLELVSLLWKMITFPWAHYDNICSKEMISSLLIL